MTAKKTVKQIEQEKVDKAMEGVALWAGYYRWNLHRFAEEYLNIHLKLFQCILIMMMNVSNFFMYLAARGQGKSFLVAVFAVIRCILYPGTIIRIASKTRTQGNEVIEKIINILMPNSANLRMEILEYKLNTSEAYIKFKNTSVVSVVSANDNARHNRGNIVIVDEFRMVPLDIIQSVLRKFLTTPRSPGYLKKKEYAHLTERNKEIYLSSAWFKSHWSFEKFKTYCANLVNDNKKYFVCGLPYQLSIREGLLDAEAVQDEMEEEDFSEISWSMEMECLFWGDSDGSFFAYDDVAKNRRIQQPIYPNAISANLPAAKLKIPELAPKERRILSADVALLASKKQNNDAASIFINSALPNSQGRYVGNFIYSETHEGLVTQDLALLIRRYFEMFHCTDIALDVKGLGIGVYDCLIRDIYDPDLGITYSPLSCCNDAVFADRCADKSAPKVIWALQATSQFNSDMYIALRDGFKQGRINLLISENDAEETLKTFKGYERLAPEKKLKLKLPYIDTTLLIMELIGLDYEAKGTTVKVHEKSNMRKDRVSSVGYNYYVQCQLERKYTKAKGNSAGSFMELVQVRQPDLYRRERR